MTNHQNSTSGMTYPQFIVIMAAIMAFCIVYVVGHYIYQNQIAPDAKNPPSISFPYSRFPMNYCGDSSAGGTNKWYSIYINYNQSNLINIRNNFCCDAYYNRYKNTIQIASFYNQTRAQQFALILKNKGFQNIKIGTPQTISTNRSPKRSYSCS